MKDTKIEWATHTFNPWIGCQKVSPACKHCYAEELTNRFGGDFSGTRRLTSDAYWREPLKWNRDAEEAKERPRVFCASLADVFEDWDGPIRDPAGKVLNKESKVASAEDLHNEDCLTLDDVRARLFALIDSTPNLDWLLLTKRPESISRMWLETPCDGHVCDASKSSRVFCPHDSCDVFNGVRQGHRSNVWLGTTVENQEQSNKRIPELLKCRDLSPVLFLSCEPLLGPVDLKSLRIGSEFDKTGLPWFDCLDGTSFSCDDIGKGYPKIDWVIAGGESGRDARPMHPDWARSLRDQCQTAGVPFHFKQWGEWAPYSDLLYSQCKHVDTHAFDEESNVFRVGKKAAGRILDGREWSEVPK